MEKVGSPPVMFPVQDPAHCSPPLAAPADARQGWALSLLGPSGAELLQAVLEQLGLELGRFSRDARADTTMELLPVLPGCSWLGIKPDWM